MKPLHRRRCREDKEAKTLRNSEIKIEDNHNDEEMEVQQEISTKKLPDFNELKAEDNRAAASNKMDTRQVPEAVPAVVLERPQSKSLDGSGRSDLPAHSLQRVFMVAARLARKKRLFSDLPEEEQDLVTQELEVNGVPLEEESNTTSPEVSERIYGTVPVIAQDQPITTPQCDTGDMNTFAVDETGATPNDTAMNMHASNGQAEITRSLLTHPNDAKIPSSTPVVSESLLVEDDPKEHKSTAQVVTAELQNGNADLQNDGPVQIITTEPDTASREVTMDIVEPVTKVVDEAIITEVLNQPVEPVTAEQITAPDDVNMEVPAAAQDAITEAVVPVQEVATELVASASEVISDLGTAADVSMEHTEPVIEVPPIDDITVQTVNMEPETGEEAQVMKTENP
ncbi:hypothetical protein Baya_13206 [Bagarius yarrelli]|uniref:Uncharacterized protein n=1 Tax=Bagarius yarrelli TaxID=175774 RepID=A0A556V523_BAGYA|nr:hypothetical protein Baya_13206 [Bagarius yarrelli]